MRREKRHVCAVLPVKPEPGNGWLADDHADIPIGKPLEYLLFPFLAISPGNLYRSVDCLRKHLSLVVEVTPRHARLVVCVQ